MRPDLDTRPLPAPAAGLGGRPATTTVTWGLRPHGGRGWYVDASDHEAAVVYVLPPSAPAPRLPAGGLAGAGVPALSYRRRHDGHPEHGWLDATRTSRLIAVPEADGRFLVRMLLTHPDMGPVGAMGDRTWWSASDPIFLVGAVVCAPTLETWPSPVHQGRLGPNRVAALRAAQRDYDLIMAVATRLVAAPIPWGGDLVAIAQRVAGVMVARYPDLLPRVATDALTRTIDRADLPVMPEVATGDGTVDDLLTELWAAWAFGPRATVAEGRSLVRRARPTTAGADVDRLLIGLVATLQLTASTKPLARS